jgi:DNA-binding CsgD family transcriptional regulator
MEVRPPQRRWLPRLPQQAADALPGVLVTAWQLAWLLMLRTYEGGGLRYAGRHAGHGRHRRHPRAVRAGGGHRGPRPHPDHLRLDEYVFAALRAGACGFLLKHPSPEGLVEAVRTVAAGDGLIAPSVTRRLIAEFARTPAAAAPPTELDQLTERERAVLELVARGRSNAEIAEELVVGATTVKTHVGHVLTKLGLRDRIQAVIYAYETGLVTPGSS